MARHIAAHHSFYGAKHRHPSSLFHLSLDITQMEGVHITAGIEAIP